jgi:hypothetical protein
METLQVVRPETLREPDSRPSHVLERRRTPGKLLTVSRTVSRSSSVSNRWRGTVFVTSASDV